MPSVRAGLLHVGLTERRAGNPRAAMLPLARAIATDARESREWSWARRRLAGWTAADERPR